MTLSEKIKNLMIMNGITNEAQLVAGAGVSRVILHEILTEKEKKFSQEFIKKIADFFDVTIDYLLNEDPLTHIYIPESERYHCSISSVMRYLMQDVGNISEAELFRRTGVPQPTIHRILSGMTPNPRKDSIEPIATFFNITTDQLLARTPLPKDRIPGTFVNAAAVTQKLVPLLVWDEVIYWPNIAKAPDFKVGRSWIISESGVQTNAFAFQVANTDYAPEFRKGTVIIVSCDRSPKPGQFILAATKDYEMLLGEFNALDNTLILFNKFGEEVPIKNLIFQSVICEAKHIF